MAENYKESDLEIWLREHRMTTESFASLIGCSRQVIWKIKRGIPVCPLFGKKIFEATKGRVKPLINNVGRQSQKL